MATQRTTQAVRTCAHVPICGQRIRRQQGTAFLGVEVASAKGGPVIPRRGPIFGVRLLGAPLSQRAGPVAMIGGCRWLPGVRGVRFIFACVLLGRVGHYETATQAVCRGGVVSDDE